MRAEAERRLRAVSYDCFLIRMSKAASNSFCLSLKYKRSLTHLLFQGGPGKGYNLPGADRIFHSLTEVVKYCRKTSVILPNDKCTITFPCPQPKILKEISNSKVEELSMDGENPYIFILVD